MFEETTLVIHQNSIEKYQEDLINQFSKISDEISAFKKSVNDLKNRTYFSSDSYKSDVKDLTKKCARQIIIISRNVDDCLQEVKLYEKIIDELIAEREELENE
jgi:hypothetical protein